MDFIIFNLYTGLENSDSHGNVTINEAESIVDNRLLLGLHVGPKKNRNKTSSKRQGTLTYYLSTRTCPMAPATVRVNTTIFLPNTIRIPLIVQETYEIVYYPRTDIPPPLRPIASYHLRLRLIKSTIWIPPIASSTERCRIAHVCWRVRWTLVDKSQQSIFNLTWIIWLSTWRITLFYCDIYHPRVNLGW